VVVSRKICCLCYGKQVGSVRNGCPRALQGCKGERKAMLLEEDKKRDSKRKEGRSVVCALCPW